MLTMKKLLIGGAGLAALATAAPSAAQYYGYQYPSYGYSQYPSYGYSTRAYGYAAPAYGYGYAMNTSAAASQCTAAVQNRLYTRNGVGGILGSLIGAYGTTGRVLGITRVTPNGSYTRVRGLASSGRYGGYNTADLSFKCDVDYRGYVRDLDINRR
jgi:hypothetical protein